MIHVIGNATIDTVIRLKRFPLPGETVVAEDRARDDCGGKGANQAIAVARCGTPVRLVAAIGDDEAGQRIAANLMHEGVLTDGLWSWPGPSDRCIIYVDHEGENTIVSLIEAAAAFDPLSSTGVARWVKAGDHVMLQGNLRPEVTHACLALARQCKARTVFNPSPTYEAHDYDWGLVDLAVVNRVEAIKLGGVDDPLRAAEALLRAGAGAVVLTEGRHGATWIDATHRFRADAPAVEPIDTVGAGDVFCGTLVAAMASGRRPRIALIAAAGAAAIAVTRRGVVESFPSRCEIRQVFGMADVHREETVR